MGPRYRPAADPNGPTRRHNPRPAALATDGSPHPDEADARWRRLQQRSDERGNSRNGYRHHGFDTLDVAILKLRSGSYFPEHLVAAAPLERRKARAIVIVSCYLLGVSTQRTERLVDTLGITSLSKSQVSVMAEALDTRIEAFRSQPLDAGPYTFVAVDALVLTVREN